MQPIADAGLIIALRSARRARSDWAKDVLTRHGRVFTCEMALAEAAAILEMPEFVARLVRDGDLVVDFHFENHIQRIHQLLRQYGPDMDLADACIVRMTELVDDCLVYTVDRRDFARYRRHGTEAIPFELAPEPE